MKEATYPREWFRGHYALRDEYRTVADVLHETFVFVSCVDIGCGVGFIIERLHELGHEAAGVDGCENARAEAPEAVQDKIRIVDITAPLFAPDRHDLVVCTEVAEHLEAVHADRLVEVVCGAARGSIFFTAATPGQGGNDHVNEQPHEYWIQRFEVHGKTLDMVTTLRVRERLAVL